ncbi:MAG TPA: DUF3488 and transglutaminase-like domain-containing protein [Tessaracoccus flavescens]|uniref:DUF3488 and transglutaminase-like domain-containing protein n=1 Tax=Tessaracoccus flavescens TaxID=399497 RepID=A0A921EMW4_9ACTN|nr:DUF3488 and transglutaminase-like domain-containing protein [Tessaracoccus flavescens]
MSTSTVPRRAAVPAGRGHFGELTRGRALWVAVDAVAVMALLTLVALAFFPVYGTGWLFLTVLGFGAIGIGLAILAAHRRWGAGRTGMAGLAAWFLAGSFLVMPSSAVAMVVPTPRTLFGLLVGPVTAWRDMLTLEPPIGETFNLLAVPGFVALTSALFAMLISLTSRRPMLAWLPLAGAYIVGAAVGSQVAYRPLVVGAIFFVIVLVWSSHRRGVARQRLADTSPRVRPFLWAFGAATLAVAGLVAAAVVPVVAAGPERTTLRAGAVPPIDVERYSSPLQGYRANITQHLADVLFEVDGAAEGDIIRLATLDRYDGLSYRVSTLDNHLVDGTTFARVGQWIDDDTPGAARDLAVRIRAYEGVWTPTVGRTTEIRFDGDRSIALGENFFYNRASGTGLATAGLRDGDHYTLGTTTAPRPSASAIGAAPAGAHVLPESQGVPDELRTLARLWTDGAPTAGAAALRLEENLRQGYFSHGQPDEAASAPGHSERRLMTLLADPGRMVGDHEQYAVAMALMAREIDIPARVIYGYRATGSAAVTGQQVGAWPELHFDGLGWVTFDPTPPVTNTLEDDNVPKAPEPQPYIENPPPPPLRPEVPPPDEQLPIDPGEPPAQDAPIDWALIGAFVALTGIPLLTVVVPVAVVLGLKLRRRSQRRHHPVIANRVAGAWAEMVDRARDLGRSPSTAGTRSEQAAGLIDDFPRLTQTTDPISLAKEADWVVFAPGEPTERVAADYWGSSKALHRGMRRSINPLRWIASFLSTKSFRRVK